MNSTAVKNTNQFLNSMIPLNNAGKNNGFLGMNSPSNSGLSGWLTPALIFLGFLAVFALIFYYFYDQVAEMWKSASDAISGYFGSAPPTPPPAPEEKPPAASPATPSPSDQPAAPSSQSESTLEKILPGGKKEVFNVSSNRFTYYDAEPLCKSLGAELASYDQVKEAWKQGADWCNYGWVKGQMAVYPTSDETYQKMQGGPAEQRNSCGRPGVNGGYFDNPELRYGVNCYGAKPPQSKHDETRMELATPTSPDAVEFDKKVAQFKAEADTMGVLPFNKNRWD